MCVAAHDRRSMMLPLCRLKGNREILISDTVGFIQKLPTELVAAFRWDGGQRVWQTQHAVDTARPSASIDLALTAETVDACTQ